MKANFDRPDFAPGCVVVIGGSGGIGSVAARLFAARGVPVVVTYCGQQEKAADVVKTIEDGGGKALAQRCDVADRSSIDGVLAQAQGRFGTVHSIICAQGKALKNGPVAESDPNALRAKFETDLIGFINIMQACLPPMRAQGGGSVTAIVSPTIDRVVPGYGMAMTTKAGLAGIIRYFAVEEGPSNVRVNAIAPGVIDAGMALQLLAGPQRDSLERAVAATPLRRRGLPQEVAELLFFLASSKAGFITGQTITVDGGFSL